jgi:hypothetical protein
MTSTAALGLLESTLLQRRRFAHVAGMTFEDDAGIFRRDVYEALGYKRNLRYDDYLRRYERGGIAERIVDSYPYATWSIGARIVDDSQPGDTEFETEVVALFQRLGIWTRLLRADILANIHKYSGLLIGAKGSLKTPLPRMTSIEDVLYLQPLSEVNCTIGEYEDRPANERFALPKTYNVNLGHKNGVDVHWTRILHIADVGLESDILGVPRLRACWNYLDDLEKLVGGGSEAAWKRMDPGLQLDLDPEVQLTEDQEEALNDEVDEYLHNMRRVLRTRGVTLNPLASDAASFGSNVDAVLKLISSTTGVPLRILLGSERGELASTQDRNNWNDRITGRRITMAEPAVRTLVDRLVERGALPAPDTTYSFVWPDIEELDEKAKAEVVNKLTNANSSQFASEGKLVMTAEEIRRVILNIETSSEDDLIPDKDDEDDTTTAQPDDSAVIDPTDPSSDGSGDIVLKQ